MVTTILIEIVTAMIKTISEKWLQELKAVE